MVQCGLSCSSQECQASCLVSAGVTLPLEIFMTKQTGWGVRSARKVPRGKFICEYAGAICTEAEAVGCFLKFLLCCSHLERVICDDVLHITCRVYK